MLPSYYGMALDLKLKNGEPLNFDDLSALARELGKSIQQYSYKCERKNIRYVASKIVAEYPAIVGKDEDDKADLEHLICQKLFGYIDRKRREIGMKKSVSGGRPMIPKHEKIDDGPARRKIVGTEAEFVIFG
ncbi:Uncharacterized protein APZ42_031069 [Daphnia magna]|uniref:Uncharacterized protein n=1 Tax=Daphnia magna TaxID=35525 RepID=A0A164N611_9CRUS|nr:Uncharacterized protein APZ42_031069 [Daphnia magna]